MRSAVIAAVLGVCLGGPALVGPASAQDLPAPFENANQIVCVDEPTAVDLLAVYDHDMALGDNLLAYLASHGVCERATFSGKPVADRYEHHEEMQRDEHVFEVDVTKGIVLGGRLKAYMLLFILHDNQA
jgi:hypothetical protein